MPIYEYRCDACGHTFEVVQKFSDKPVETCEVCGGRVTKVLHPAAIHFKGSGFYTTDYGRSSKKAKAGAGEGGHEGGAKTGEDATRTGEGAAKAATGDGASKSEGAGGGGKAAAPRSSSGSKAD